MRAAAERSPRGLEANRCKDAKSNLGRDAGNSAGTASPCARRRHSFLEICPALVELTWRQHQEPRAGSFSGCKQTTTAAVSPTRTPLMLAPFPSPTMGASNGFCIDASSASARSSRVLCIVSTVQCGVGAGAGARVASSHDCSRVARHGRALRRPPRRLRASAPPARRHLLGWLWLLSGFLIIPPAVACAQGLLHRPFANRHHLHHRRAEAARLCCAPPVPRARRA